VIDHEWVAAATYDLSPSDARRAAHAAARGKVAEPPIELNHSNLREITSGCWKCEQPLALPLVGGPCPGEPEGGGRAQTRPADRLGS